MKLRTSLILALVAPLAMAQNQPNLSNGVKGQLPVANAQQVLAAAQVAAQLAANTASAAAANTAQMTSSIQSRNGATIYRGAHAHHGYIETFSSDGRCVAGTSNPVGFEYNSGNADCVYQPGYLHPGSGTLNLEHALANGSIPASPAVYPPPSNFASAVFTAPMGGFSGGTGSVYVGFDTCSGGSASSTSPQYNCGAANEIGVQFSKQGLVLQDAGNPTLLWDPNNSNNGVSGLGTTNSSQFNGSNLGWGSPQLGFSYSVGLVIPGDGTAIVSAVPVGGGLCYSSCWVSFRVPITMPSGNLRNFFVRGNTADFISDVAMATGFAEAGTAGLPIYAIPPSSHRRGGLAMRWALHQDGTECTYSAIAPDCSNVFALVPPNYNPDVPNPWDLYLRGQEFSMLSFDNTFRTLANYLFVNGHVQVFGDWHGRVWYGGPNDIQDIASAQHIVRDSLSLSQRPHTLADSAGGVNTMNAITHGALRPQDVLCYSCNLSLLSDAQGNNNVNRQAGVTQMPLIETDYGFTDPGQYSTVTAGYDPVVVVQSPLVPQASLTGGLYPLLQNSAQLLASTPMLFVADAPPGDDTVTTSLNTTAFYTGLNALNPGTSVLSYVGGGHISSNKFDGVGALNFILSHQ